MHFDISSLSSIWQQIQAHGFVAGLMLGPIGMVMAGKILPPMTKAVVTLTARIIPPIVGWVRAGMVWVMAFPVAKGFIVANKDGIKKLLDAIVAAIDAIVLAVDTTIDDAIDAADKPAAATLPAPARPPEPKVAP